MKALVILSGGMDSATALACAVRMYGAENVHTLTFNYGSKHNEQENFHALKLANHYEVQNRLIELPFINEHFKSDLLKSGGAVPEGHYADESMKKTVVPFRNGIMLSIAAGFAESNGCEAVLIGNHAGDHTIYPDCRLDFIVAMSEAMKLGCWAPVRLLSPFCKMTKTDIVKIGAALEVPYEKTYSCYAGKDLHCGKCGTCVERVEAFKQAGIPDPTVYQ